MTRPVKLALGLWLVLALVVFNVTFDWQARLAGFAFIQSQHALRAQGQPVATIEDGFRPLVRDAAGRSSIWLLLILAGGTGATALAARRIRLHD